MSVRGIRQLKYLRLYFCDLGGSSAGIRDALKSEELVDFMNENKHVSLDIIMRRNHHPYVSAVFINGYTKDVPLRKVMMEDFMWEIDRLNKQYGRRALKNNIVRASHSNKSV